MNLDQERLAGILKMYEEFNSGEIVNIEYSHDCIEFTELSEKYNILDMAGVGDTESQVLNLLLWLSTHVFHNGSYENHIAQHPLALLEYSYDKPKQGINCLALATILTESLLSIGIKARTMYLHPFSPYDTDNHVVTEAYIPEKGKWIMIDPTCNSYFMNSRDEILSALEAREMFANRELVKVNDDLFYNNEKEPLDEMKDNYREYMSKNLFYIKCNSSNKYYSEEDKKMIYFYPKDFDIFKASMINIEYRKELYKDNPAILELLSKHKLNNDEYVPSSSKSLVVVPESTYSIS